MGAAQKVPLSDEVQKAVATSEDLDEAYKMLDAAAEFYRTNGRPMTLADYQAMPSS